MFLWNEFLLIWPGKKICLKLVFESTCFRIDQEDYDTTQINVLNWLVYDSTKREMIRLEVVVELTCFYFDQEENDPTQWNLFLNHI